MGIWNVIETVADCGGKYTIHFDEDGFLFSILLPNPADAASEQGEGRFPILPLYFQICMGYKKSEENADIYKELPKNGYNSKIEQYGGGDRPNA